MSEELVPMTIGWFDMPLEMREMIMEQMEVKTKGKFLRCSKDCVVEVKRMKHFIREIRLILYSTGGRMEVIFIDGSELFIIIEKFNDKIILKCGSSKLEILSKTIAAKRIRSWTDNTIHLENLQVKLIDFPFDGFDIAHLKKLKNIKIISEKSFDMIFKTGFMEKDQFWSIENITMENVKLANEDLCDLKSSSIELKNTNVSAEMLNQFIKTWKRGKINKSFTKMKIEMKENKKNKTELSSIILKDVNAIGEHEKHYCIWVRLMNSNNEWAEIHISSNSFIMICKTSAEKFEYKAFDIFDEMDIMGIFTFESERDL
ncbi:unnamed protein product [Caenorhabditis angaria]|uniref:Sdz-33 F-box domain-containing protein n=1 Tax=Caenorhabditis angaria TaxID=860376 RepID=A0A9P1I914_9PELO|nr:unnamed protein product [Caenorhabditis angaria]